MPIYFLARRKAPQQWAIDEYQLAAVISLWRSGMTRLAIRQHPRRKIMQGVGDGGPTAAAIRLWVAGEGALQQKWVRLEEDEIPGLVPFRLSSGFILDGSDEWFPYVDGAPSANFRQSDLEKLPLLALETSGTLLEMIAQDIFATFMFEAASVMDKLSEVAVRQPLGASGHPTILRSGNTMSSTLSNPHVDALARILCGSGLATEEAALMCIIPALFHHSKLPSLDDSVELLLSDVEMLRSNRQYERGEAQLKALFKICASGHQERVVRTLGEMYREACRSPSETQWNFGLWGMASLRRNLVNVGAAARETLSQSAMMAITDYEKLYGFLKDRPRWRRDPREPQSREQLPMIAVLELHKGLVQPREGHGRCRFETLLVLEKYDMTGRTEAAIHELLFTAIALGHVEVLEDLKVLNPDILVEQLVYATALPDGAEPLTRHLTSRFNSEAQDNQGGVSPTGCCAVGFLAVAWAAAQLEREARVPGEAEGVLRTMLDWALRAKTAFTDGDNNTALMYAVGSGNAAAVDISLECGVDFQVANAAGETALSRAVTAGQLPIAERIIKKWHDRPSLAPSYLDHALSVAFRVHKRPFVDLLLWNGAGIGYLDPRGESLLFAALDPFLPVELGSTCYEHARTGTCHERDPDLVTLLLENGAVPGDLLPDLLQAAIDNGAVEWIRQLQARGHDIAGVLARKGSLTAVLEAAMRDQGLATEDPDKTPGFDPLLMLLLDLGVPVAPGDLQRAIRARSTDSVVAVMLEKGGSTYKDAVLEGYGTPLQTLVGSEFRDEPVVVQEKMLRLLIDAGCDVNLDSACWKATPLQIVCSRLQASGRLVSMLISAGADVNLTAADLPGDGPWLMRNPPLVLACVTANAEVVKALLDAGAEVDTGRAEFGSPLQAACLPFGRVRGRDRVEIVEMLVKAGANVNAVGEPGETALGLAAHSALLPDVVETLLDAGADPDLAVGDETLCAHKDLWDDIETRRGRLMRGLRSAFKEMQQGPFGGVATVWGLEGPSEKRREEIRRLLAPRAVVYHGPRQAKGINGG